MRFLFLFFCLLLLGCTYNLKSVWVEELERELALDKLIGEENITDAKNEKNYLSDKKILVLPFPELEEAPQEFLDNLKLQAQKFFVALDLPIELLANFSQEKKKNFYDEHELFLENLQIYFRVHKDLSKTLWEKEGVEILLLPQLLFYPCETCKEKDLVYLRLSLVNVKRGELVWFVNDFYRFSKPESDNILKRTQILWQNIEKEFIKTFVSP